MTIDLTIRDDSGATVVIRARRTGNPDHLTLNPSEAHTYSVEAMVGIRSGMTRIGTVTHRNGDGPATLAHLALGLALGQDES